jgi:hypothetical protein
MGLWDYGYNLGNTPISQHIIGIMRGGIVHHYEYHIVDCLVELLNIDYGPELIEMGRIYGMNSHPSCSILLRAKLPVRRIATYILWGLYGNLLPNYVLASADLFSTFNLTNVPHGVGRVIMEEANRLVKLLRHFAAGDKQHVVEIIEYHHLRNQSGELRTWYKRQPNRLSGYVRGICLTFTWC